jgi:cytochrome c oxidase cbb3-type subunit I
MAIEFDDRPVKVMLYPAIIFLILGLTIGTFLSFNTFVFPDFFSGEHISFGRLRPVHVGHVTLLWLLSADVGLFYYFVPRLCGVPLWSPKLALWSGALWWFSLVVGIYSLPFGTNYGYEYAELPMWVGWLPIKALFTLAWVLVAVNIFVTIGKRRYKKMYVSLWYVMGTLIWTTFTYVVGNFALELVPGGISRININYFYVHNLVGLVFTPMGVAAAYYYIPKIANTPLYSHRLSMVGFWTIAFVYAWVGAHHIIHGPVSQWLQTTSIIFSLWLFIPVWTVVANFLMTLRGQWIKYQQSPAIRFLMLGTIFYLIVCIQGPMQAFRNVNAITSKTDWVIGHSHMALYGAFTFFAFGGIYHTIPAITRKPLWSEGLAYWHFSLNLFGALIMIVSLSIGGFLQGLQWSRWSIGSSYADFHMSFTLFPFLQTIASMTIWWVIRGLAGIMILVGNLLFLLNMMNTIILKPRNVQ